MDRHESTYHWMRRPDSLLAIQRKAGKGILNDIFNIWTRDNLHPSGMSASIAEP